MLATGSFKQKRTLVIGEKIDSHLHVGGSNQLAVRGQFVYYSLQAMGKRIDHRTFLARCLPIDQLRSYCR